MPQPGVVCLSVVGRDVSTWLASCSPQAVEGSYTLLAEETAVVRGAEGASETRWGAEEASCSLSLSFDPYSLK